MRGEPAKACRNCSSFLMEAIFLAESCEPAIRGRVSARWIGLADAALIDFWRASLCGQTSWHMSQPYMRLVFLMILASLGGILSLFSIVR